MVGQGASSVQGLRGRALLLRTQSDSRLADLARAGHRPAFDALVERYRAPLAAYAWQLLPDSRSEDVLRQGLAHAWSSVQGGPPISDVRDWLYRSVHNAGLTALSRPDDDRHRRTAVQGAGAYEAVKAMGFEGGPLRELARWARTASRAAATALVPLALAARAAASAGRPETPKPAKPATSDRRARSGTSPMATRIGVTAAMAGVVAFGAVQIASSGEDPGAGATRVDRRNGGLQVSSPSPLGEAAANRTGVALSARAAVRPDAARAHRPGEAQAGQPAVPAVLGAVVGYRGAGGGPQSVPGGQRGGAPQRGASAPQRRAGAREPGRLGGQGGPGRITSPGPARTAPASPAPQAGGGPPPGHSTPPSQPAAKSPPAHSSPSPPPRGQAHHEEPDKPDPPEKPPPPPPGG
jgi:DNA-directed RNA polymerase specialized sigma24 family protein